MARGEGGGRRGLFLGLGALAGMGVIGAVWAYLSVKAAPAAEAEASPTPLVSQLKVHSEPSGAVVRINGKISGGTPLTLAGLPLGLYQVEAELSGYEGAGQAVALTEAKPTGEVILTLAPAATAPKPTTGLLDVVTEPAGARVEVGEVEAGKSPITGFVLPPGSYAVKVSLPEHESVERHVEIVAGKTEPVSVRLRSVKVYEAQDLDAEVRKLSGGQLKPPTQARSATVVVTLFIDYDGQVEKAEVSDAASPSLAAWIKAQVKDWRYEPGLRNGVACRYRVVIPVPVRGRRSR